MATWRIEYWLQSINSKAKNAPVLLIGTHVDESMCSDSFLKKVNAELQKEYATRFPNIRGMYLSRSLISTYSVRFFISGTAGTGVHDLKQFIAEVAIAEPNVVEEIPVNYLSLLERVEAMRGQITPPYLPWTQFSKMAEDCTLAGKDAIAATKYLHEMGDLVYFNDPRSLGLSEMVMLDPQWLIDVLSTFLSTNSL
jgi:hypothetical protein